jgi:hypothetical protein
MGAISFPFPLAENATGQIVAVNGPSTPQCPGSVAQPQAAPGFLCVYFGEQGNLDNANLPRLCRPTGLCSPTHAGRTGATVQIYADATGLYYAMGSWAVTAP